LNPSRIPPELPRSIRRFIRFFLRHEDAEGREAEFDELFREEVRIREPESALRAYRIQFVLSLPGLIANYIFWEVAMLKNYLTIAWRNLGRNKVISFINVAALLLALVLVAVFLPAFVRLTGETLDIDWAGGTFLIIGAFVVLGQFDYMVSKGLGYGQGQILLVPLKGKLKEPLQILRARLQEGKLFGETKSVFKQRLLQSSDIRGVTFITQSPGALTNTNTWTVRGERKPMIIMQTDPDFVDVLGLEIVSGRNLSWDRESDLGLRYLVNEAAVPYLGLDPLSGEAFQANFGQSQIVGVIKDFHFQTLHQKIGPMAIVWFDGWTAIRFVPLRRKTSTATVLGASIVKPGFSNRNSIALPMCISADGMRDSPTKTPMASGK